MTQFLRVNAVARRYDVTASTIWRWANEERFAHLNFPKFIKFGPNTAAIDEAALDRFDVERIAMRDGDSNTDDDDNNTDDDDERPP